MTRIFLSYRRSDSKTITGRIYDRLVAAFGKNTVFRDVDDIPPGADFREVLEHEVASCDVLLVIMGPTWAAATDADGQKRLNDPDDFVRIEVETALRLPGVRVIPVLVQGASMPGEADLPSTLRKLPYVNAVSVRDDPDFTTDMNRLVSAIAKVKPAKQSVNNGKIQPIALAAAATMIAILVVVILAKNLGPNVTGNNNVVIGQNDGVVNINQGDPPEKKAQFIASKVYEYAANMDKRLLMVETTLGADVFSQKIADAQATEVPALIQAVGAGYDQLLTQQQIDNLRQTFNDAPIPTTNDSAITNLAMGNVVNPLTLTFLYQRLGEFQDASDELLKVLETSAKADKPDAEQAAYWQARLKLTAEQMKNRASLAYLTALIVLSDVTSAYPTVTVPLDAWVVLEPRKIPARNEISEQIAEQGNLSLMLYDQRNTLLKSAQAKLDSEVTQYQQEIEGDLTIHPTDEYNQVIGKAVSLRQFGRTTEALAAFDLYKQMFAPSDDTAKQYADTAVQFTLQINELGVVDGATYIFALEPESMADKAGLQVGDIVLDINGKSVHSALELQDQLKTVAEGDKATLTYLRLNADQSFTRTSINFTAGDHLGIGFISI